MSTSEVQNKGKRTAFQTFIARQDKTRRDKTRHDKTRQDKTKTRQDKDKTKTRQDKDKDKTRQDKTRQDKIKIEAAWAIFGIRDDSITFDKPCLALKPYGPGYAQKRNICANDGSDGK